MSNALVIYIVLCLVVGFLGRKSRLGMMRSILMSFLLTPLIMFVYLLLFASMDNEARSVVERSRGR
ncbi:hypothetical protein RY831_16185 [Noviherbaspirillum sp. CPCC 100848]|uniref:Transmembrane protein n=1 Tax=Noviherbaspirillum album TaxID=3080276 RepID=A0ABU6JAZ1_9BURK|nr:hypothetical protein [Noviherbaspirillum sp. CPCC 100848]MEC4720703.1 hypothetical protein [Noviherbaspirillum sp. CPCC 100848]